MQSVGVQTDGKGQGSGLVHGGLLRTTETGGRKSPDSLDSGSREWLRRQRQKKRDRRNYRQFLRAWAQKILYYADVEGSLRGCGQGSVDRRIGKQLVNRMEIHAYPDSDAPVGMVGVAHCGSPLCPDCGPTIAARRVEESAEAAEKLLKAGFVYIFLTFTAWHPAALPLIEFMKKYQLAWRIFYNSAEYKSFTRKYRDRQFSIVANEVTADDPDEDLGKITGWQLHQHRAVFLDTGGVWLTEEEQEAMRQSFLAAWRRALEDPRIGLTCSNERGVFVQTIQHHASKTGLKVPFDKLSEKKRIKYVRQVAAYISKSLGLELSGGVRKTARHGAKGGKRISLWGLLERAVSGSSRARDMWIEAYKSFHEKRLNTFRMSPGLRDFCNLKEKSDEEVLTGRLNTPLVVFGEYLSEEEAALAQDGLPLPYYLDWDDWIPIARQGRLAHLLYVAEVAVMSAGGDVDAAVRLAGEAVDRLCRMAAAGLDILEPWKPLGENGLPVSFGGVVLEDLELVVDVKPRPHEQARLDVDAAEVEAKRLAHIRLLYDRIAGNFWERVIYGGYNYAVGKREAMDHLFATEKQLNDLGLVQVDLFDQVCRVLRSMGWVAPSDPRVKPVEQLALL